MSNDLLRLDHNHHNPDHASSRNPELLGACYHQLYYLFPFVGELEIH
jgi:hypothetical protein